MDYGAALACVVKKAARPAVSAEIDGRAASEEALGATAARLFLLLLIVLFVSLGSRELHRRPPFV